MTSKDIYKNLCSTEVSIPIFSQDWWMDAVCGEENWDVILLEKSGQVIAAMPYYYIKKGKKIIIKQPLLTQTNGLWIKYPANQKTSKRISYENEIADEIINKLEQLPVYSYDQNFKYNFTNWLSFYWRGYTQTTRYTYIIDDLTNFEEILQSLDSDRRRNIRKAEKFVKVKYDLGCHEFYENHKMTLERLGKVISYPYELFSRIYEATYKRNQGKVFYAVDESNNIHAAIFIIWDENSAYGLISAIDPRYRYSGAGNFLVYEAIKYISKLTKVFDFEGSMIKNVELAARQFGTQQKQYFNISKEYGKKNLVYILAKDVYDYYPWIQRTYSRIRD